MKNMQKLLVNQFSMCFNSTVGAALALKKRKARYRDSDIGLFSFTAQEAICARTASQASSRFESGCAS
jgi:hypothetical protein